MLFLVLALFCIFVIVPLTSPFSAFIPVSVSLTLARLSVAVPMPVTINFVRILPAMAMILSTVTSLLMPVLAPAAAA